MPLLRSLRDRLADWLLVGRPVEIEFTRDQLTEIAYQAFPAFDARIKPVEDKVALLLRECPQDYRKLADRLTAVETKAGDDRAKLDALDEFTRDPSTEGDLNQDLAGWLREVANQLAPETPAPPSPPIDADEDPESYDAGGMGQDDPDPTPSPRCDDCLCDRAG